MFYGLGSGENGQITFLDALAIIGFLISLENLDLNISQEDIQNQTKEIDARVDAEVNRALNEIHKHLQEQDIKISTILDLVKGATK